MPPSFDSITLAPIYRLKGIPAMFTPAGEDGAIPLTVTEDSSGVEMAPGGILTVQATRRAVRVRRVELAGFNLAPDALVGGTLAFGGERFTVKTHLPAVGPKGPSSGELTLTLEQA